jgi:uncharacterized protein YegL
VEGSELVFAVSQSLESSVATSAQWSITVPASGAAGVASFADFDSAQFVDITASYNSGTDTWTLSGAVNIPAGSTSAEIRIPTYDDVIFEGNENLTLTLSNVTGGAQLAGGQSSVSYAGVIVDNEAAPVLSSSDTFALEGDNLVFSLSQSAVSSANTSVDWQITLPANPGAGDLSYADLNSTQFVLHNISAVPNSDGSWTLSGTATVPAGATGAQIVIPTRNDSVFEGNESLSLTLSNVTGGAELPGGASQASYQGTLTDGEDAPLIEVGDSKTVEGADLVFPVSMNHASVFATSVDWSVTVPATGAPGQASFADFDSAQFVDITASYNSGTDTWTLSGTVNIPAGSTSAEIRIPTYDDAIFEGIESLQISLSNASQGAQASSYAAAGLIHDNESSPVISSGAASVTEGGNLTFTVNQSLLSVYDSSASWSVIIPASGARGTASYADFNPAQFAASGVSVSGPDSSGNYTLSGTVSIPAGSGSASIIIPTLNDAIFEGNETLSLILSNPQGAQLPGGVSSVAYSGLIVDNDSAPSLPAASAVVNVDESWLADGSRVAGAGAEAVSAGNSFKLHPDEIAALTVRGASGADVSVSNGLVVPGRYGYVTFTISGDTVSYTYTLTEAYQHSPDSGPDQLAAGADQFALAIAGTSIGAINVGIEDDAPVLTLHGASSVDVTAATNFAASGSLSVDFGADGPASSGDYIAVHLSSEYAHTSGNNTSSTFAYYDVYLPKDGAHVIQQTATGELDLYLSNGQIMYAYHATYGVNGDQEKISFQVTDSDGDSVSRTLGITLKDNIPSAFFNLDEAGLPFGSLAPGHGEASDFSTLTGQALQAGATGIVWDMTRMPVVKADGDLNGTYSTVTWQQEGNILKGYADGKLVMSVEPQFDASGHFTGSLATNMYRPLQHGLPGSASDDLLNLDFVFQQTGSGAPLDSAIRISVRDDAPSRNDDAGKTLEIMEAKVAEAEVYLVLDVSGSISSANMTLQVNAIRALAQAYIDNGINSSFSLVTFGSGAIIYLSHVSPQELLDTIKTSADIDTQRGNTYYNTGIDALMYDMAFSVNNPLRDDVPKTVYFISDGAPSSSYWTAAHQAQWNAYRAEHEFEVWALGVGSAMTTGSSGYNSLVTVAGDASHVLAVSNYNQLGSQLVNLLPKSTSNIFDTLGSADVATVVSVTINGAVYALNQVDAAGLHHTGPITLPNGSVIDFYENGVYNLRADNVSQDFSANISFNLRDADGDTYSTDTMTLLIRDFEPVAHDNTNYMDTLSYASGTLLGNLDGSLAVTEGWTRTPDCVYNIIIPVTARPGSFPAALVAEIQSEYGITLNSGGYVNNNRGMRLTAESRTTLELTTTVDYATVDAVVVAAGGRITGYPSGANRDMAIMAHEVNSRGGEILVSWGASGRNTGTGTEQDGSFYILLDERGNVVDSGVFMFSAVGSVSANGIWRVNIPDTGIEQTYKLVLGSFDGGSATSAVDSILYVDSVIQLNDPQFAGLVHQGNVVKDRSEDGLVDEAWDGAYVGEVIYKGQSYLFAPGELVKTIETDEGSLYIGQNGDYLFKPYDANGTFSGDDFQYRLVDRDGDWSLAANVRLGGSNETMHTPVAYDDMAHTGGIAGGPVQALMGNVLTDAGMGGAADLLSASTTAAVAGIYYNNVWYAINASTKSLEVTTGDGGKLLVNADGSYYYYRPANGQSLDGIADRFDYVVLEGTGANARISQGTTHLFSDDRIVEGTDGGDRVNRSASFTDEAILSGAGNDLVLAGSGDTVIDGGAGNDVLIAGAFSEGAADAIRADLLADGAITRNDAQTIADMIDGLAPSGADGDNYLYGGGGNDALIGGGGADKLSGGAGADVMFGGAGNDVLQGGSGADIISGGAGNDSLSGGDGADVFIFGAADSGLGSVDTITDFDAAAGDTIELGELLAHLGTGARYELVQDGENTLINILNGNNEQQQQIVLEGTNAQALQNSNAIYSSSISPMMQATDVDNELMSNFLDGILGDDGTEAQSAPASATAPQEEIPASGGTGGSVVDDYQQAMQEQMDITKETGV